MWLLVSTASAGGAEGAPRAVDLRIGTILASNDSEEFDPKLSRIKNQLEVIKFSSYRLIKDDSQQVPWRTPAAFDIPGGHMLVVEPQVLRSQRVELKISLTDGQKPLVDTKVRLRNRGYFLLGGPAYEGGVLILSISAIAP